MRAVDIYASSDRAELRPHLAAAFAEVDAGGPSGTVGGSPDHLE